MSDHLIQTFVLIAELEILTLRRTDLRLEDLLKDRIDATDEDGVDLGSRIELAENRESYTAYNGSNVWNAIYEENCMLDRIQSSGSNPLD